MEELLFKRVGTWLSLELLFYSHTSCRTGLLSSQLQRIQCTFHDHAPNSDTPNSMSSLISFVFGTHPSTLPLANLER
jgi:hypothetical protein